MENKGFTHEPSNSKQKEWYTPPEVFELLRFPEFDLDPASPGADKVPQVPAKKHYTIKDNGLMRQWEGRVWLNPPYGKDTPDWLSKLALHGNGIALVFARTDTLWFHTIAVKADAICFLNGRIRFIDEHGKQGNAPGCGSMLLAWGKECADILVNSGQGWCIDNREAQKPSKADVIKEIGRTMDYISHDRAGQRELVRVVTDYIMAL